MTSYTTVERLHALRLPGMAAAFGEQLQTSAAVDLPFEERLALLLEREVTYREDRRLQRLLQDARLALAAAAAEDIDWRAPRGLDRSVLVRLISAEWVRQHQVVLLVGATGVGKSYLACALGHAACRHGLTTRYFRLGRLLHALALARADGSYPKLLLKLAKTDLVILDLWEVLRNVESRPALLGDWLMPTPHYATHQSASSHSRIEAFLRHAPAVDGDTTSGFALAIASRFMSRSTVAYRLVVSMLA